MTCLPKYSLSEKCLYLSEIEVSFIPIIYVNAVFNTFREKKVLPFIVVARKYFSNGHFFYLGK